MSEINTMTKTNTEDEAITAEAYQHEPIRVVLIDVAHELHGDKLVFRRSGKYLIVELSKFSECIMGELEYTEDGDGYLIRMSTMTRKEFSELPEHGGW